MVIKFKCKGEKWRCVLLSKAEYITRFEGDSCAITELEERVVYSTVEEFTYSTILHELVHCYFAETSSIINSADLTAHQMEELFCEFFELHSETIIKTAKSIIRRIKKHGQTASNIT